ncbi:hypothetical protein [Shinella kummerowiae]|uniref:hypothetical protein n=1 Tax=Shinella kummerowiae TaxID=417745 RepID=UPI0021B698F2|nr:hypothetical protein [Shinella kummerowiae]MCT7665689.1 hypothetical protein [Shinella kummerowiae]
MSRIRTIKPEFFTHEELFDAEQSTGLPLRLAFAGLWTQCDRDGRFNWRHRQLKVAIMPYDTVDFSRVLDALATRGFVVKYTSGTSEYGFIPSWTRHQVINNRERASVLPAPTENIEVFDASITREQREDDAGQGEGKGREGKGRDSLSETSSDAPPKKANSEKYPRAFEAFWQAYPRSPNMSKSKALAGWKKLTEEQRVACAAAVPAYKAFLASKTDHPTMHATTFINERRFEGFSSEPAAAVPVNDDRWKKRLVYAREKSAWPTAWGPRPSQPGCGVPTHLLEINDGLNWTETETVR